MSDITISKATQEDALWLANATLWAERAHTGRGIWDALLVDDNDGSEETALQCLADVIANAENSHLYYNHVFVARSYDASGGKSIPVSSCSGYGSTHTTISATLDALKVSCMSICKWSSERYEERRRRLSFLQTCFPEWVPYDGEGTFDLIWFYFI